MARETAVQAVARRRREREAIEEREREARNQARGRPGRGDGTRPPAGGEAFTGALREAGEQAGAAARGAQDALTLGLGDRIYAGGSALFDAAQGGDLGDAWRARIAAERARDQYDALHYRTARTSGEMAGTGLGLLALGPVDGVLAGGVRIAETAPMVARELAALGGLGAGGGVASQAVTDLQRRRPGSAGDYVGAALGGAVTALASARGAPAQSAALGGAATSMAQNILNGRRVSWEDAGRAALAGGYAAAPIGLAGRVYSDGLHFTDKGRLGETLGRLRTRASGDIPLPGGRRVPVNGGPGYTVLDQESRSGLMSEQKFGRSIRRLSPNQQAAHAQYGNRYRVDHFLPRDVGAAVAYPFGLLGYQQVLGDDGW